MKFSCKTKEILHTIGVVSRAVSGQQAMPILNNILFKVEGKTCTLSATNLEFSIISHLDAEVENEGEITVPSKAIQNFTQYMTDKEIIFESSEDAQLKCRSKKSKTVIAGESATEYPTISPIQKEIKLTVSSNQLFNAIYHVGFASAKTTTRPVLSGVYCRVQKNNLILVATDSYRLSEYKVPIVESHGEVECIIPAKVLIEVMSILGAEQKEKVGSAKTTTKDKSSSNESSGKNNPQQNIYISLSSQQIEIIIGKTTILSRLIDGVFPDYQQILPSKNVTKIILPHHEFLADIKRMNYFAKEGNNNLTITVSSDAVLIQTQVTQSGRDESNITAEVRGEKNKIALSASYLLDFLSRVQDEEVQMDLIDKMHPAVLRAPSIPNFLHLIMPLRIMEEE